MLCKRQSKESLGFRTISSHFFDNYLYILYLRGSDGHFEVLNRSKPQLVQKLWHKMQMKWQTCGPYCRYQVSILFFLLCGSTLTFLRSSKNMQKFKCSRHLARAWHLWGSLFDRSLVEAVQGIALSGDFCLPFAQIWDIFRLFCHVFIKTSVDKSLRIMTCLDMFENRIKLHHKHYDMSGHVWESYQIAS